MLLRPNLPPLVWLEQWVPTVGRLILGLVSLWFGLNELLQPRLWTGYVPMLSTSSTTAVVLVLVHGGVLFVLGIALILGIAPRIAALVFGLMLLEIIVSLTIVGHGLNDIVARDVGVFGLALVVGGSRNLRLVLTE